MISRCQFKGTMLGDMVVKVEDATASASQPVVQVGILQTNAAINADSRNLVHSIRVTLLIERSDNEACFRAMRTIRNMLNLTGDLYLTDVASTRLTGKGWTLSATSDPDLALGFGGRYTDDFVVTFVGPAALT